MSETETYVLSTIRHGTELSEFDAWCLDLKTRNVHHALLKIELHHDHFVFADLWRQYCPSHRIGLPFVEARLVGNTTLSALLVWLSFHRRSMTRGTTIGVPHYVRYPEPLYEKILETIAARVRFTDIETRAWGSNLAYRRMRAAHILSTSPLISGHDLIRDFGGSIADV